MTPETKFLHQNTKDMIMPTIMLTTMPKPTLVFSSPPHLVLETHHSLLMTRDKVPSQEEGDKGENAPCPDVPCHARARTASALDTPVHTCASSLPTTSRPLLSPTRSP
jgi:hypothetical protein